MLELTYIITSNGVISSSNSCWRLYAPMQNGKFKAGPWSNANLKATRFVILFCFALLFLLVCLFVCFFACFFFLKYSFGFFFCLFFFCCCLFFCFALLYLVCLFLFCFVWFSKHWIIMLSNMFRIFLDFVLWIRLRLKSRVKQTVRMLSNPYKWGLFLFLLAFSGAVTLKSRLQITDCAHCID